MLKRLGFVLTLIIATASLIMSAFAAPVDTEETLNIDNVIASRTNGDNGQFLVTISRPDKAEEAVYEEKYLISGIASEDVVICLARYNEETKKYEDFYNLDNESRWETSGMFFKEIKLDKDANKIKLVVYPKAKEDSLKKSDVQINKFTINYLDENIAVTPASIFNAIVQKVENLVLK